MLVVPQQEINILNNNIPDNNEPIWDSDTTYNKDDLVQFKNYVYQSLMDENKGNQPDISPLAWYKIYPINRWALFDGWTDTQTIYDGDDDYIYYEVKTSDVDYIAFFNLYGSKVRIELLDSDDNVFYEEEKSLITYNISDWYEWTYNSPIYRKNIAFNLPMLYDGKLKFYVYKRDGIAKVGNCAYGRSQNIGVSLYGARVSRRNIIKQSRDEFGRLYTSLQGQYQKINVPVMCDTGMVDSIVNKLADIASVPTLFIADEREGGFETLLVYGIYKDFDIPISVVKSRYEIEIEGVG